LIGFVFEGVRIDVRSYYQVERKGIALGQFVQSTTNDRDLVIMAFNDAYGSAVPVLRAGDGAFARPFSSRARSRA